jgi:hypothetical protein
MSEFIGLANLGVLVRWEYAFVGFGSRVQSTTGQVCVDVGGELCPGVLDHHQINSDAASSSEAVGSSSELVVKHPEYVYHHLASQILEARARGEQVAGREVVYRIVTHRSPDWDGVVAVHLIQHLLSQGCFPRYHEALVQYASRVDQGGFTLHHYAKQRQDAGRFEVPAHPGKAPFAPAGESEQQPRVWNVADPRDPIVSEFLQLPHIGQLMIENLERSDHRTLERSLELLKRVLHQLNSEDRKGGIFEWDFSQGSACREWTKEEQFRDVVEALREDPERWKTDAKDAGEFEVALPTTEGSTLRCVKGLPEIQDQDPEQPKVHLCGLGRALEREECIEREKKGKPRLLPPRWPDVTNRDPWYDGRDKDYTICDSPRTGTELSYARIIEIVKDSKSWGDTDIHFEDFVLDLFVEAKSAGVPLHPPADSDPLPSTRPPSFSQSLDAWWKDLRLGSAKGPPELPELPQGLEIRHDRIVGLATQDSGGTRITPQIRWVRVARAPQSAAPSLQKIQDWRQEFCKETGSFTYSVSSWRTRNGGKLLPSQVRQLRKAGLIGSGNAPDSKWKVSDRVLNRWCSSGPTDHPDAAILILYVATVELTLIRTSLEIGSEDAGTKMPYGRLLTQFLEFQGRYYQLSIVNEGELRTLCESIWNDLKIDRHYREIEREIDRMVSVEEAKSSQVQEKSSRHQQMLLAVISAFGILQTVDLGVQAFTGGSAVRIGGLAAGLVAAAVILSCFWWWLYRSK